LTNESDAAGKTIAGIRVYNEGFGDGAGVLIVFTSGDMIHAHAYMGDNAGSLSLAAGEFESTDGEGMVCGFSLQELFDMGAIDAKEHARLTSTHEEHVANMARIKEMRDREEFARLKAIFEPGSDGSNG
jgi:hypothetical protein